MADELYPSDFTGYYYGGDESGADASYPSDFGGYWYGEDAGYGYETPSYYDDEPFNYEPGIYYDTDYPTVEPSLYTGSSQTYGGYGGATQTGGTGLVLKPMGDTTSTGTKSSTKTSEAESYKPRITQQTTTSPLQIGQTSTTRYTGGGALPTMNAPSFNLPAYDYGRINYLTQQQMAPLATKLQGALYTGIGKIASTDNPYMQAQARKQLMQGYGGGLSQAQAGAAKTAQELYNTEYGGLLTKAGSEYGGQLTTAQTNFQAAMQEWLKSLTTEQSTTNLYGTGTNTTNLLYG
jgi:hypothetical protein